MYRQRAFGRIECIANAPSDRARFLLTGLKQYGYCTYVHKGNSYEANPVFLRILFYLPLTGRRFVM
ncbi:hypothetical protein LTSEWAN_4217 [Salmonella enterica subsp. enterica serovar Wandsworth str. A4-580]|uniref:Uncharacterized protein n=1 Tax=Salmonella enterica subsp. enterica serovar Wandsworth str. A4-580 TaxID=913086 RepID=G5SFG1_SALET|nr:hypothetical protein LTSEWAN_4217 [Salmonella enterica subsp. enterica serovar Wandsworth str. A4-580]